MTFLQGTHQVAQKSIISGPSWVNSCKDVEVPSNKRILILGMIFSEVILSADKNPSMAKVEKATIRTDFRLNQRTVILKYINTIYSGYSIGSKNDFRSLSFTNFRLTLLRNSISLTGKINS